MDTISEACHQLHVKLHGQAWYGGKVLPNPQLYNSIVAYVKYQSAEIEKSVPQKIDGFDVRAHFLASLCEEKDKFVTTQSSISLPSYVPLTSLPGFTVATDVVLEDEVVTTLALDLHNELWKLRRVCGADNLTDIFYEVHDGTNALTSVSQGYPEVRTKVQELYNEFGFDVLFEELDS